MGAIVGNAIASLITLLSLPAALIVAGLGLFMGLGEMGGDSKKRAEGFGKIVGGLLIAVLLFNAPAIWPAVRSALGF